MSTLPITVPNTFANQTVAIPLSNLDNNFTTVVTALNGIGDGTTPLANANITGGVAILSSANITSANIGTAAISGNVTAGNITSPGLITGANLTSNNVVVAVTANISGNVNAGNAVVISGFYGASANITGTANLGNVAVPGVVTVTGNLTAGNISTAGTLTFSTAAITSLNGGPLAGFRNLIINGDLRVNQRVATTGTAYATGKYTFDRWKGGGSGVTMTWTAGVVQTTATITAGSVQQVIEGASVAGGTYTFSWSGTATGRIAASGGTPGGAYAASPITITGATAGQAITVELTGGTFTTVQVEPGATATVYERRPIAVETALCQRYFAKSYDQTVALGTISTSGLIYTVTNATGYAIGNFYFPVEMRADPTVTFYNNSTGGTGTWRDGGAVDRAMSSYAGTRSVTFYQLGSSANSSLNGHLTAEAEL